MKNQLFLKFILERPVDVSTETYQNDFKGLTYTVNWDIYGAKGYQIFEQDNYTYKSGELHEDPDVTLSFLTLEFVDQLLAREKLKTEMGRSPGGYHMCRNDLFISTRCKTQDGSGQVLASKVPSLRGIVPSFGTSRRRDILGMHFVATYDHPLINQWLLQENKIGERLEAMRRDLHPPYDQVALPQVLRPEDILPNA